MMDTQRIPSIELSAADERTKRNFEKLTARIGRVPNMPRAMAQSPAVLDGYMSLSVALIKGRLGKRLGEELALTLAGTNRCEYCASAHSATGKLAGLKGTDVAAALQGKAEDASEAAALKCASAVVEKRGRIDDADFKAITDAGFTPGEVSEIVAHVVVNTFSNYFNNVARTEIDFHSADGSKAA
jgi:AhpD family alkylhydroperoxidase